MFNPIFNPLVNKEWETSSCIIIFHFHHLLLGIEGFMVHDNYFSSSLSYNLCPNMHGSYSAKPRYLDKKLDSIQRRNLSSTWHRWIPNPHSFYPSCRKCGASSLCAHDVLCSPLSDKVYQRPNRVIIAFSGILALQEDPQGNVPTS